MRKALVLTLLALLATTAEVTARDVSLPYPILGGELSNSAATSPADIDEVMPRMKALGLNTVLVPAYWELLEPVEGQFDYALIDRVISVAREQQLKVVFLWFGAWKNSMSCYAPAWFKQDTRRFPRAMTAAGKPLEIASCFSPEVRLADVKAFSALMRRIGEKDPRREVVIMMQIENEIGMLESARDHSPLADSVYLKESWASRYGTDDMADEKFMALHYARYVEQLAQAARHIHDMPLYVNAAMNSRGRRPGEYPSAGPLAHLMDFWHKGAPSIDMLSPDIYDTGFKTWAAQYAVPQRPQDGGKVVNRLFIPETRCCTNSGVRALYAFGEHAALGFSPFAIDQADTRSTDGIKAAYSLIRQMKAMEEKQQQGKKGTPRTWGLLFDQEDRERVIDDDGVVMTCRHYFTLPWDARATDGSTWPEGGAMVMRLGKHDYLLAGSGIVVDFKTRSEQEQDMLQKTDKVTLGEDGFAKAGDKQHSNGERRFTGSRLGLLAVDEVTIGNDGTMTYLRRHNGDQSHQGRHARISVGEWKILHIKLYEYAN